MLEIHQIPVLSDNYIYLIHDPVSQHTAVVDPAVSEPVLAALTEQGWRLTHILNTHHHGDHVGGNRTLKAKTGCTIVGAGKDRHRIPGIDVTVGERDTVRVGSAEASVFEVPGHTLGHIAFWFSDSDALFCGDTLFAMGCGRLFEGSAEQMWHSLAKLKALPGETRVFCAHEYTEANGRFALAVEPDNRALIDRMEDVVERRRLGLPTIPSIMAEEWATNPFLRSDRPDLKRAVKMEEQTPSEVFAELRRRKDRFR
jgi:hydroxyacylglutathione hydrolase